MTQKFLTINRRSLLRATANNARLSSVALGFATLRYKLAAYVIAAMVAALAGWETRMSPQSIVLAVGFSAAIGIFFGYYPARKAAALLPIQALRYE